MESLLDGDHLDRYVIGNRNAEATIRGGGAMMGGRTGGGRNKAPRVPLGVPPGLSAVVDMRPLLDVVDDGRVLEGTEIREVSDGLRMCLDVLDWRDALLAVNDDVDDDDDHRGGEGGDNREEITFVELPKLVESVRVDPDLLRLLSDAFDPNDPDRLDGTTFPSLGRLRSIIRDTRRTVLDDVNSLLASPGMRGKLATESGGSLVMEMNGRLVIPVRSEFRSSVGGIVHDASRSGGTVYVEPPGVIDRTNDLRGMETELRGEENRIWRQLSEAIGERGDDIERNAACLGQLDVVLARVKLGKRFRSAASAGSSSGGAGGMGGGGGGGGGVVVPEVRTEGVVCVRDALHPILLLREDDRMRKKNGGVGGFGRGGGAGAAAATPAKGGGGVVGSDVDIGRGENQGLILTGPNSGGKTIILVRAPPSFVCAENTYSPPLRSFFARLRGPTRAHPHACMFLYYFVVNSVCRNC
jgi:DNA mismatch repair protein MutS2